MMVGRPSAAIGLATALVSAWFFFAALTAQAAPAASVWTVFQVAGDVLVRDHGAVSTWRPASRGEAFDRPFSIETGGDGHATLIRGNDVIHVSPRSKMQLAPSSDGSVVTRVVQTLGTLFFGVETRRDHNFRVKTPYLVTLVKGTTFRVSVTDAGADVAVAEGVVTVRDSREINSRDVSAGQAASVSAREGSTITVQPVATVDFSQAAISLEEGPDIQVDEVGDRLQEVLEDGGSELDDDRERDVEASAAVDRERDDRDGDEPDQEDRDEDDEDRDDHSYSSTTSGLGGDGFSGNGGGGSDNGSGGNDGGSSGGGGAGGGSADGASNGDDDEGNDDDDQGDDDDDNDDDD